MKYFGFSILLFHITNACLEPSSTTVHIQNYDGPIYVNPGDNCVTTSNPASQRDSYYPSRTNIVPHCDNRYPTLGNLAPTNDNQVNILHNSVPYKQTLCETDCKCVTQQKSYIPIAVNSVPQNTCTPGYYNTQYPPGCYGYVCPETSCSETDVSSPSVSDTLIPLLKTYLSQACPKHGCQCGRKHSQNYFGN